MHFDIEPSGFPTRFNRYTTTMMAEDAVTLIRHLGWHSVHLVGFSLGGMIATELAYMAPDTVRSLSLVATAHSSRSVLTFGLTRLPRLLKWRSSRWWSEIMYPNAYLTETNHRQMLERFYTQLESHARMPSLMGALTQLTAVLSHHVSSRRLSGLQARGFPILIVAATKDLVIHSAAAEYLYKALSGPATRFVKVADAGHGVIVQCADTVAQELKLTFHTPLQPQREAQAKAFCATKDERQGLFVVVLLVFILIGALNFLRQDWIR